MHLYIWRMSTEVRSAIRWRKGDEQQVAVLVAFVHTYIHTYVLRYNRSYLLCTNIYMDTHTYTYILCVYKHFGLFLFRILWQRNMTYICIYIYKYIYIHICIFLCVNNATCLPIFFAFLLCVYVCMRVALLPKICLFGNKFRNFGEISKNKESYNEMVK